MTKPAPTEAEVLEARAYFSDRLNIYESVSRMWDNAITILSALDAQDSKIKNWPCDPSRGVMECDKLRAENSRLVEELESLRECAAEGHAAAHAEKEVTRSQAEQIKRLTEGLTKIAERRDIGWATCDGDPPSDVLTDIEIAEAALKEASK